MSSQVQSIPASDEPRDAAPAPDITAPQNALSPAAQIDADDASDGDATSTALASTRKPVHVGHRKGFIDRIEAGIARLSAKNNFWHRVCSMIWLPYAFRSGIRMKQVDENTFAAELPFRRFNRNWYNAMAGAALLGNSEIAGGMFVFGVCGGDYSVVCKHLEYKFLRPCFGPALYRITPREDIKALVAAGQEFNITIDMEIVQLGVLPKALRGNKAKDGKASFIARMAAKDRRVGRCTAVFHVTPQLHNKAKRGHVRNVG